MNKKPKKIKLRRRSSSIWKVKVKGYNITSGADFRQKIIKDFSHSLSIIHKNSDKSTL